MLERLTLCLAGLLILTGCASTNLEAVPGRIVPGKPIEAQLSLPRDVPLVEVAVDGAGPYWFIIDTGASCCIVAPRIAAGSTRRTWGTYTTPQGEWRGLHRVGRIHAMELCGITFFDFDVLVADLDTLALQLDHPVDGVIGMPLIREGVWELNYPLRTLRIEPVGVLNAGADDVTEFMFRDASPTVPLVVDTFTLSATVDTGSSGGLQLSSEDAAMLPFRPEPGLVQESHGVFGSSRSEVGHIGAPVRFHGRVLPEHLVAIRDKTSIGGAILAGAVVAIDARSRLLRVDWTARSGAGLIARYIECFNAHDVDLIGECLAGDVGWYMVDGDRVIEEGRGSAGIKAGLERYFAALPTVRAELEHVHAAGSFCIARERVFWTGPDGQELSQAAYSVYEVRDGRIASVWYFPPE